MGTRFQKGKPKTGGRRKGIRNKKTILIENFAKFITDGGQAKFEREMKKLRGAAYIKAYQTFYEYVKPKLARTELTGKDGEQLPSIKIVMPEKGKEDG